MTRSQEFIQKNRKKISCGADFYNVDTTLMHKDKFTSSKLKFLLVLPSPSEVKTVSSTLAAINDFVISNCPDVFIDFAYFPNQSDIKIYDTHQLPYALGIITHLDASHFDMVGFSISVLSEIVTTPVIMKSFSRCDTPIPLTWSERKDLPLGACPVFYSGGITASCGDVMFGPLGDGRTSFLDFSYLGSCERMDVLFDHYLERKGLSTVQEYIDSLFQYEFIYQPQAYKVVFNDKNQIIENTKINPKAQDFVSPYYPHQLSTDLGIGRTVIPASGGNVGVTQTQVSEGLMLAGTLVRTSDGLVPIEDVVKLDKGNYHIFNKFADTLHGIQPLTHAFAHGPCFAKKYVTERGYCISLSDDHPVNVYKLGDGLSDVPAGSLKVGDFITFKRGCDLFGSYSLDVYQSELLGIMVADGLWGEIFKKDGTFVPTNRPEFVIYEKPNHFERVEFLYKKVIDSWSHNFNTVCRRKEIPFPCFDRFGNNIVELYGLGKPCLGARSFGLFSVPSIVGMLPEKSMKAFLKGVFNSSTCAVPKSNRSCDCFFSNLEYKVVSYIQQLLLMCGVPSKLVDSTVYRNKGIKVTNYNGFALQISPEWYSILSDWGCDIKDVTRFSSSEVIPANESYFGHYIFENGARIPAVKKTSHTLIPHDMIFDRIISIQNDFGEGYDLTVPTTEHLIANGVSIHNCSAAGACSFCHEGNYTGGWVEKTREQILHEVKEAKKYSAGYKYKPYSFNANYISDYKGFLYDLLQIYPKVTFINMRLEELGRDTDALVMMKLIGSNRISAPIEGISPRLQNNLLNKCLSEESLTNFMNDLVHMKLTDIKVGAIFTGYEEDEDFEWLCDFVDKVKQKARQEGGNLPFRLKACLTQDALTPIPGKGLVRQDQLQKGKVIGYTESEVVATEPQGLSEIYKLTTSLGTVIKGTPNHKVVTTCWSKKQLREEDYTSFEDLKVGDSVYHRIGTNVYGDNIQMLETVPTIQEKVVKLIALDEEMAKVLGWYMGDGYINSGEMKTWGMCFGGNESYVHEELKNIMISRGYDPKEHDQGEKNMTSWRIHNASLTRAIEREFGHSAKGKRVSNLILQSPKQIQVQFLKYWFSADGTISNQGTYNSRVKLYSINRDAIQDAQAMLFNMGILCRIGGNKVNLGEKEFYTYYLEIKSYSACDFIETIGLIEHKQAKFQGYRRGNKAIKKNGVFKARVESIERSVPEETYGIEVETKSYLTNGILSHNTPLVHYQLTPLEYIERKAAKRSFNGERWLPDYWYERFKESEIYFKVNGFRYSTFIEQSLVDLGRSITPLVYNMIVKDMFPVYSLRSIATDDFISALKKHINSDYFFEVRDPEHYISLSHRIHIELMGSYIPRARRLVAAHKRGDIFSNVPDIRCLKTYEGAKTHCMSNCMKDDPFKVYNDVRLDSDYNLQGDFRMLLGCERCATPDLKKMRLARPTPQTKNSDDIIACPRLPQVQKVRFLLSRRNEYDLLNPNNTAHTFITKFLQSSDRLLNNYHSVAGHSMFWQSDEDQPYVTAGYQIVDTVWSDDVIYEIKSLVDKVNSEISSTRIIQVREELMDEKLQPSDYNVFYFESTLPYELFESARYSYKGEIKVKLGMDILETKVDPSLLPPIFVSTGKVVGYFAIPVRYNPENYLQGFLNSSRASVSKIVESTNLRCVLVVREASTVCKSCGKEKSVVSLLTGKSIPFGVDCLTKALLTKTLTND